MVKKWKGKRIHQNYSTLKGFISALADEGSIPSRATNFCKVSMYTTYVLFSEKFEKHYTGYSSDVAERVKSHNHLNNKDWTKRYRPWKIIYSKEFITKSEAIKYEKWLKSGKGREFIKTIPH